MQLLRWRNPPWFPASFAAAPLSPPAQQAPGEHSPIGGADLRDYFAARLLKFVSVRNTPKMHATIPLMMYQVVPWVNRPVNVLLTWSAMELEACIPTCVKRIPLTIKRTMPPIR